MNKVSSVKPLQDGKVFVEMADGCAGVFDVKPYMGSDFFRALLDENYFNQVRPFFMALGGQMVRILAQIRCLPS
jgi:hypothetical protein